ncbi:uncharacterized protein [Henckelia pumila]|uniref:uncharacterized protein n=1 Tax=Henckelia pumila TaxID=405737 RepID=UPI003C6E11D1
MSHPYFTPSVIHGYGTPHTIGMPFISPMSNEPATPTFVPETQLSDRESPIESSWTNVEEEVLAKSFVTISDDPIFIANDQKTNSFWGRVASYYNKNHPPSSNTRSANVIRSHWHNTIQKKHVWKIVKDRPLFTPQSADHFVATKKTRTSESGASNTSSNQNVSIDLDDEDSRPMGQKTAKRNGKRQSKITMEDLKVNYDNIFENFTEYTSIKKSEVGLKQKQLEVEEIKAKTALSKSESKNRRLKLKEYEILNKDTSQMTNEQLIIHECMC